MGGFRFFLILKIICSAAVSRQSVRGTSLKAAAWWPQYQISRYICYFVSDIEDSLIRTGVSWFGNIQKEATEWAPSQWAA